MRTEGYVVGQISGIDLKISLLMPSDITALIFIRFGYFNSALLLGISLIIFAINTGK